MNDTELDLTVLKELRLMLEALTAAQAVVAQPLNEPIAVVTAAIRECFRVKVEMEDETAGLDTAKLATGIKAASNYIAGNPLKRPLMTRALIIEEMALCKIRLMDRLGLQSERIDLSGEVKFLTDGKVTLKQDFELPPSPYLSSPLSSIPPDGDFAAVRIEDIDSAGGAVGGPGAGGE